MSSQYHQQLSELMQRELDTVAQLQQLLEQELTLLRQRDATALQQIAAEKGALVEQLEGYGRDRAALLGGAGYSADRAGLQAFISGAGSVTVPLSTMWEHLRQALKRCQTQNLVNGQVLEGSRRGAEQVLAILRGSAIGARTATYTRQGQTRALPGGHTFARA